MGSTRGLSGRGLGCVRGRGASARRRRSRAFRPPGAGLRSGGGAAGAERGGGLWASTASAIGSRCLGGADDARAGRGLGPVLLSGSVFRAGPRVTGSEPPLPSSACSRPGVPKEGSGRAGEDGSSQGLARVPGPLRAAPEARQPTPLQAEAPAELPSTPGVGARSHPDSGDLGGLPLGVGPRASTEVGRLMAAEGRASNPRGAPWSPLGEISLVVWQSHHQLTAERRCLRPRNPIGEVQKPDWMEAVRSEGRGCACSCPEQASSRGAGAAIFGKGGDPGPSSHAADLGLMSGTRHQVPRTPPPGATNSWAVKPGVTHS